MQVTGIFPTVAAAQAARRALASRGIGEERVTISVSQTADGIAAEAPGQSYENQPGQPGVRDGRDEAVARFTEAVRSGDCALTVDGTSRLDEGQLAALLREFGARRVAVPPPSF